VVIGSTSGIVGGSVLQAVQEDKRHNAMGEKPVTSKKSARIVFVTSIMIVRMMARQEIKFYQSARVELLVGVDSF